MDGVNALKRCVMGMTWSCVAAGGWALARDVTRVVERGGIGAPAGGPRQRREALSGVGESSETAALHRNALAARREPRSRPQTRRRAGWRLEAPGARYRARA